MAKTSGGLRNTIFLNKRVNEVKLNKYSISELIRKGESLNKNKVEVTFIPAYNEEKHKNLPEKLKRTLKISKKEIFSIITEPTEILDLLKSKDVKSIKFI